MLDSGDCLVSRSAGEPIRGTVGGAKAVMAREESTEQMKSLE